MNKKQKQRTLWVIAIIVTGFSATGLTLYALGQNVNAYYTPKAFKQQHIPLKQILRVGGLVKKGSFVRKGDGLNTEFILIDVDGSEVQVLYRGVLPVLFREGQGIIVEGMQTKNGVITATQVLAKHDETYEPPGMKKK